MRISNWGNYPVIDAEVFVPRSVEELKNIVVTSTETISRGLGRCYGDSSLNQSIISTERLNHFLSFDSEKGILTCESGVSLAEILEVIVPKGWFLPVTPGTKFVTLGGAIAADVHGKNHHRAGSLSAHIVSMSVMLSDGTIVDCSREENSDLYWATCGGMGLTGVIVAAAIQLLKIETAYIRQRIIKTKNLDETFQAFEENKQWTYSVAWIDCLSSGEKLGRAALILGEHATTKEIGYRYRNPLILDKKFNVSVPFFFPNVALNPLTMKLFNAVRYLTYRAKDTIIDYEPFFYPLDTIRSWNRIYGKRGFTQYQFVLPNNTSKEGIEKILKRISTSGEGSFFAVLKQFGKQEGMLSFPQEGYTLALDFAISSTSLRVLDELDSMVQQFGGRLYLAKDSRMKREVFRSGYQHLEKFRTVKGKVDPHNKFRSLQSQRLEL